MEKDINWELIVAALAVFVSIWGVAVAFLGIVIGAWYNRRTLNMSINHNKKITAPHLQYHIQHEKEFVEIKLLNNGFGPAFIKDVFYEYRETKNNKIHLIIKENYENFENEIKPELPVIFYFDDETIIKPNGEISLCYFKVKESFKTSKLLNVCKEIKVTITYKTVYNDKVIFNKFLVKQETEEL